jgi:hypothetical protein
MPCSARAAILLTLSIGLWSQDTRVVRLPGPPPGAAAAPAPAPAAPAPVPKAQAAERLRLEWPAWLRIPGGEMTVNQTTPQGKKTVWSSESCPGDKLSTPSQGCIHRVYLSSWNIKDVYDHLDNLLDRWGYSVKGASTEHYAYIALFKSFGESYSQLTERQWPNEPDETVYSQIKIALNPGPTAKTKAEVWYLVRNEPDSPPPVSHIFQAEPGKTPWYQAAPENRGDWSWIIQTTAFRSGKDSVQYQSFFYEQSTQRSVEARLPLPNGGTIVHSFPVDAAFWVQDEYGHTLRFENVEQARGKAVGPGNWTVYPIKVGGIVVYFR